MMSHNIIKSNHNKTERTVIRTTTAEKLKIPEYSVDKTTVKPASAPKNNKP